MNKTLLTLTCLVATAGTAHADDFFSRIDRAMSSVENTITRTDNTINRVSGTADRINSKIPESENTQPAPATQAAATQPAAGGITAEEQAILDQAARIEEQRILREAEAIRSRRGAVTPYR